jgi:hypothetical protein
MLYGLHRDEIAKLEYLIRIHQKSNVEFLLYIEIIRFSTCTFQPLVTPKNIRLVLAMAFRHLMLPA